MKLLSILAVICMFLLACSASRPTNSTPTTNATATDSILQDSLQGKIAMYCYPGYRIKEQEVESRKNPNYLTHDAELTPEAAARVKSRTEALQCFSDERITCLAKKSVLVMSWVIVDANGEIVEASIKTYAKANEDKPFTLDKDEVDKLLTLAMSLRFETHDIEEGYYIIKGIPLFSFGKYKE